jgi:hypothetical protein
MCSNSSNAAGGCVTLRRPGGACHLSCRCSLDPRHPSVYTGYARAFRAQPDMFYRNARV